MVMSPKPPVDRKQIQPEACKIHDKLHPNKPTPAKKKEPDNFKNWGK